MFAPLHRPPLVTGRRRDGRWWTLWGLAAFVPAITYFVLPLGAPWPIKPSALFPQSITNSLMLWALLNSVLALLFGLWPGRRSEGREPMWGLSVPLALATVAILYAVVALAGLVQVDFRFWVVALKPFSARQALAALSYVLPFTLFVFLAFRGLASLAVGDTRAHYAWSAGALAAGFLVLTGGEYLILFATGRLPLPAGALSAIVAIQFVPLLLGLGALGVHTWRRTGTVLPGALIGGLFVTWYIVAGSATHFA